MTLYANARMYSPTPASAAAWRTVIDWAARASGVPLAFLDYPAPLPMAGLWARDDLGAAQMCGLPAALRRPPPTVLAAPVPSLPRYRGEAIYMSDLAVRADSRFEKIEETFGGTAGYTVKDSQSGYFAFRYYLMTRHPGAKYARTVGGLVHARGVVKALAEGAIDVGPLDSYVWDLLRADDPELAAKVRVIASTDPTPMPPLVATAPLGTADVERLRAAFRRVHEERSLDGARRALLLERFVVPELAVYEETRRRAHLVEKEPEWP